MTETTRERLATLAALLLGVGAFFVFAGWWVLIPTNIAWLVSGDRAMHQLGWMFYREAAWGLPPGSSPHLGIELANSIALADGLPLFAIPFKLIAPLLPQPFQYWGYWWLLCFVLQSLFGYRMARELGAGRIVALLAGAFVVIAPPFLFRLTLHMALAGHWTILAALWLYVRRDAPRPWMWPLLVGVAACVHAYLLVMVAGIWLVAYLQRLWLRRIGRRQILLEPATLALVLVIVLWSVGFFYVGSLGGIGFGFYRLNLLGPFITYQSWSKLILDLPHTDYDYEGLSFPGLGVYGALVLAIGTGAIADVGHLVRRRWILLLLLVVALAIYALSNVIGLGDHETAPIPLQLWTSIGAVFRASGRFVWPLFYMAVIGVVVVSARRLSPRVAALVLTTLFAIQVYDSSYGWSSFRRNTPAPSATWQTPLTSAFWDRAVEAGILRVRGIPVSFRHPEWRWLEYYAVLHRLDVDTVYLGRIDDRAIKALNDRETAVLEGAPPEANTLYILDVLSARRLQAHLKPDDLFALVDNRIVFVPGGAHLVDGLGIDPHSAMSARPWTPPVIWGMSAA